MTRWSARSIALAAAGVLPLMIVAGTGCADDDPGGRHDPCANRGTWTTVDEYLPDTARGAVPYGIAIDELDRIFVVGHGYDDQMSWWLVRRSVDGGATWAVVDSFQLSAAGENAAHGVGMGLGGSIFVTGRGNAGRGDVHHWLTRRSLDGGDSWSTVDDYQKAVNSHSIGERGVFVGPGDGLFVVGHARSADHRDHWTVRVSNDGGEGWSIADEYRAPAYAAQASGGAVVTGDGLFIVGSTWDETGQSQSWLVRRSSDSGTTWQSVDLYQHTADETSYANDLFVDAAGRLFVVGSGDDGIDTHWLVRRSTDGGETWAVVDDFRYPGGRVNWPYAGCFDTEGGIYVVGAGDDDAVSQVKRWLVRRSLDGGDSWETVDDFRLSSSGAVAYDIARDSEGSLYAVGHGNDEGGNRRWLVRKLACP